MFDQPGTALKRRRFGNAPRLWGLLAVALVQGGCGESAPNPVVLPKNVVARVGDRSIMKATLDHWVAVEARLSLASTPGRSLPRGLVPDPPRYHDCVIYLRSHQTDHQADTATLEGRCRQEQSSLERQAMHVLINHYWMRGEATRKGGVEVSVDELRDAKRTGELARQLGAAGVGSADERFLIDDELLFDKLKLTLPVYAELKRLRGPEPRWFAERVDAELEKYNDEIKKQWTPQTLCQIGYVTSGCVNDRAHGSR